MDKKKLARLVKEFPFLDGFLAEKTKDIQIRKMDQNVLGICPWHRVDYTGYHSSGRTVDEFHHVSAVREDGKIISFDFGFALRDSIELGLLLVAADTPLDFSQVKFLYEVKAPEHMCGLHYECEVTVYRVPKNFVWPDRKTAVA